MIDNRCKLRSAFLVPCRASVQFQVFTDFVAETVSLREIAGMKQFE